MAADADASLKHEGPERFEMSRSFEMPVVPPGRPSPDGMEGGSTSPLQVGSAIASLGGGG